MKSEEQKLPIKQAEFVGASGFRVRVGTNGFQGGDAGHGCRAFLELQDAGGSEMELTVSEAGRKLTVLLGGDSELKTFIHALEFAASTLRQQSRERHLACVTVGDLKRQLDSYPESAELHMGGLQFYRLKRRGDDLVQLEFGQQVYRDQDGEIVVEEVE